MATAVPFPAVVAAGAILQASNGGGSLVTEGSALVMALAVIFYLVRHEQLARRNDREQSGSDKNPGANALCLQHATQIAALQRDVKYLTDKIKSLCNSKKN